ncbi:MAG: hypothetical protein HYZ00_14005 [Candidatus Hydrogenedentes bacterium]|nr:hypothetical protein [Candidatus Hydrogenedentota bacterium]
MLPRRPSDWEDGLAGFRGDVSAGLWLVAQRFVVEIIYGIQASESERKARFLLRLVGNRNLVVRGGDDACLGGGRPGKAPACHEHRQADRWPRSGFLVNLA